MIGSTMKWKVVKKVESLDEGTVLEEIPMMSINSETTESLRILNRHAPNQNFIVCSHNNNQVILKAGRDVIPYSRGVSNKRIKR